MLFQIKARIDIVAPMIHSSVNGQKYGPGMPGLPNMNIPLNAIAACQFVNTVLRKSHDYLYEW
jgi:hypothetical protein